MPHKGGNNSDSAEERVNHSTSYRRKNLSKQNNFSKGNDIMAPWTSYTVSQSILDVVDKVTVIDDLKEIVREVVRGNLYLKRELYSALKSNENKNILIKFLQDSLRERMSQYSMEILKTLADLGTETLRAVNNFARYQMLALDVLNSKPFRKLHKLKLVQDFEKAAFGVPAHYLQATRIQLVDMLAKLKDGGYDDAFDWINGKTEAATKRKKTVSKSQTEDRRKKTTTALYKLKNNRINDFQHTRKQRYRIMAKKNACKTSRKHSYKNMQSSKSEKIYKKNFGHATLKNLRETSQSDIEDDVSKKFPRRRRYKRKVEELNNESLTSDNETSPTVNKSSTRKTELSKKRRSSNYSISEPVNLRPCFVALNDFMTDPSADNDQFVAQYKQTCGYKGNEEIEYEVVDEAGDDIDSDQRAESDLNSDNDDDYNQEDRISTKSHEPDDNVLEEDANVSKSIESEELDADPSINELPNGKKGPCTPPLSPTPDEYVRIRRGPRTPSYSPPVPRRGPCTPPGAAPTSDSEAIDDDGDSSDSSTL